jgi:trehalose-phosphatase
MEPGRVGKADIGSSSGQSLSLMPPTNRRVPNLFQCWKRICKRIRAARDIRLFLDFDGTLVPFAPPPKDRYLPDPVRRILGRLNRHPRLHVALVSGRRNAVLREYARVPHLQLLGLYGWERAGRIVLPPRTRKALPPLRKVLKSLPTEFPGFHFEEKGVSFGLHFREASPQTIRRAQIWLRKFLSPIRRDFHVINGNRAWEIVPRQVKGKGHALREFTKGLRRPFLPIYLGDDLMDESAFKALRRGITVRVGRASPTNARFRLRDPSEVRTFLERLEECLECRNGGVERTDGHL